jgi:hypothetical protein
MPLLGTIKIGEALCRLAGVCDQLGRTQGVVVRAAHIVEAHHRFELVERHNGRPAHWRKRSYPARSRVMVSADVEKPRKQTIRSG